MTVTTHVARVLLAVVLTIGATACTATSEPTPTPTASVTPPPSPTPIAASPTPTLAPAEQDLVNAEQAIHRLWVTVDRLTNDPEAPIQDLDMVASGSTLTMFQEILVEYRTANWRASGEVIVEDVRAESPGVSPGGHPTWTATACIDSSKTTLVDQAGKSVQAPPYRIRHKSTVVKDTTNERFLVVEDEAVGTC